MAKMTRPGLWLKPKGKDKCEWRFFPTYRELKKNIKNLIEENTDEDNEITIFRSRRGEWGEWHEKWTLRNGKPHKFKEGWM